MTNKVKVMFLKNLNKMSEISEIQIKVIKPKDGLLGFASLVLYNELYLSSIGIFSRIDGSGYRITYPTKKVGDTDLQIFHPINKQLGIQIEEAIISKAKEVFDEHY